MDSTSNQALKCACGEPLAMEMEREAGKCLDCMSRRAILNHCALQVPGHLLRRAK